MYSATQTRVSPWLSGGESDQISVICLPRPYGSLHLGDPNPFPFLSRPCFPITTPLPSYLNLIPPHLTMTLPPTSSTASTFPVFDIHNKRPDLKVESTSRGDLLCPPQAEHGFPLSTTRPPPEPPPPIYEKLEQIDASINAATPSLLALICPSPKPPWWFHSLLLLAPSNQAFGICFIYSMCLFFFWFKDALLVFVKMPQKDSVFWNKLVGVPWQSIVTEKAYEADSHRNKLSNQQPTFKHPIKLDNFETNDSRIVRTQVKEIIRN